MYDVPKKSHSNQLMNTMEDHHQLHSHSFMPLLSRVDRLDSVMKDVEKKKHEDFSVWSNGRKLFARRNSRQGMPLTVATKEVGSKGSLMDRIRSLEDRLLQLSQEIDQASSKASSSSSLQSTSLWTTSSSSCAQSKSELPVSSYPAFHIQESKLQCHEYFQRDLRAPRQRMKNPETDRPKTLKLGKDNTKETACFDGLKKKKRSPCWPRMKLLGC
ncbi:uncharacterized protein LOC108210222 [Daucus carota subsp. sativus]|uniref:uncharacterized protein LOC108210222 n=1 Tax=Daucus carota subsp. sativus TaxID=79200 RepID=UPI0007F02BFE|nr:PREDICTED: uncharacterized protein LOC108210222 [Daucus carota subsp. sativus]